MSANNWTQCPRCKVVNSAKADEKERIAKEAYGKVSPEHFDTLRDEAKAFRKAISTDDNLCSTLREDWDLGILEGEFYVYYGGSCKTCGFDFEFKHKEFVK
jgi:hypothetical protein